jgi:uncharacterized protein with GYD domain
MPIYISRGRFTSDAVKGMLAKPENREEAVAKLFKSVGGKLIGWYLTFGHHDWMAIGEFPDEKAAASAILAAAAGGQSVGHRDDRRHDSERCSRHPASNLPERRRRTSGAPGANRFGRDFQSERNLSAPSNNRPHLVTNGGCAERQAGGPRWQAGVARGYEARSLSSSFIQACMSSHGAFRSKRYDAASVFRYTSGITVPPVNKSTIGYFRPVTVVGVSFRLSVIAILP